MCHAYSPAHPLKIDNHNMCLIVFALRQHQDYPLIVAANRDEFYARPSAPLQCWQPENSPVDILSGRDLAAGGTWMGVATNGQFAAVTNIRNGHIVSDRPASRGQLVLDTLAKTNNTTFVNSLAETAHHYNGFNLLTGTPQHLFYSNNAHTYQNPPTSATTTTTTTTTELSHGIFGLSNGVLNTPWPKVESSKIALAHLLSLDWQQREQRVADLFSLLGDTCTATDEQLPATGVPIDKERMLSPRFIQSPDYGTRSSTVVLFHRSGQVHMIERSFDVNSSPETPWHEQQLQFG